MTVAQTKAARRKFKLYYGKGPIGQPRYKRKSVRALELREQRYREQQKAMQGRKKKARG